MDNDRIHNFSTKALIDFTKDDTIYIAKLESGFRKFYFCQFVELRRGVIHATVIFESDSAFGKLSAGQPISSRASSCCLWGWNKRDKIGGRPHVRFHWFKNTKDSAE